MPWMLKLLFFFSSLLLCSSAFADFTGIVVKVTDGDTINVLEAGNVLHKVRLTGIDAPERAQPTVFVMSLQMSLNLFTGHP